MTDEYNSAYRAWKKWSESAFFMTSKINQIYFQAEIKRLGFETLKELSVFEFGFGNGQFLCFANSQGASCFGSELDLDLLRQAEDSGVHAYQSPLAHADLLNLHSSFDLVVAFDVLEHFSKPELKEFLNTTSRLLKPGGILLARVPSGDSPFSGPYFWGDITHKLMLGTSAVYQIAEQASLRVKFIAPPAFPILGLGLATAVRRFLVSVAQRALSVLIGKVWYGSSEKAVITPNLVFALQKPKDEKV